MAASRSLLEPRRRALRVLVVTRCFPNRAEPLACAFARQQLACLGRVAEVEVIAPIPWLPGARLLGDRARVGRLAEVPLHDRIEGIAVTHPRAPYLPFAHRVPGLPALGGPLHAAALLRGAGALADRFDVVLGTFLYPDGFAAAVLARKLGLPLVLKAHGTDVDVVARWPSVRPMIRASLRRAAAVLGVSRPMVEALVRLGAPCDRALLLANGVDRLLFRPRDRGASRRAAGLPPEGRVVLFVGDLEREKGVVELCEAWSALRKAAAAPVHLVLVGDGALAAPMARAARGLAEPDRGRLILAGRLPPAGVAEHLGGCDLLALPSWHEGTPNVVLEALASGRPVVATRVGGIPDAVPEGRAGVLVHPRDVGELGGALREALARTWDEEAMLAAAPPSWEESAGRLPEVLACAAGRAGAEGEAGAVEGWRFLN